jgi:Taurine catabolism dioxygenase TauD, TfdA family
MSPDRLALLLRPEIERGLDARGYWVGEAPAEAAHDALLTALARALGALYVPEGCDAEAPLIATRPTLDAEAAPFDRPEPIGWHGDFASHPDRPELSLVCVARPDPAGDQAGSWRLASVKQVIDRLTASDEGKAAFDLLRRAPLPFSYAEDDEVRWLDVLEARPPGGSLGMRFYEPSIVRGCVAVHGEVPAAVSSALRLVQRAADEIGEVRPTRAGSLLVIDNWQALHDRTEQSAPLDRPGREALLAFTSTRRARDRPTPVTSRISEPHRD